MQIVFDAHVHFYPCYNLKRLLTTAFTNLFSASSYLFPRQSASFALCLTERWDCFFFDELKSGKLSVDGFSVRSIPDKDVLEIKSDNGDSLLLFAGRQIVTKERLEILSLLSNSFIKDGSDIYSTIAQVKENGGIPVLNWAPGKWMFSRGKIVSDILSRFSPGELVIGDTSLRPQICEGILTPPLMAKFKSQGFQFIYGSDPLPFAGEEALVGTYMSYFSGGFEKDNPEASLKQLLTQTTTPVSSFGFRSPLTSLATRLYKNTKTKD